MKRQKWIFLLLASLLVCALMCAGASAYMLKQTEIKQTVLSWPVLKCEVHEEFDGFQQTSIAVSILAESNMDAYVRIKLISYWVNQEGFVSGRPSPKLSDDAINASDWLSTDDGIYYYKWPVAPGSSTENLLNHAIVLQKEVESGCEYVQVIEMFAEAIQAYGNAVEEAWKVEVMDGMIASVS